MAPRNGGDERVWLPGSQRCFISQAAAQEAWVRANSDVLPGVLTSEKSRLGGNAECKGDKKPRPLSSDSREGRKWSAWGLGLVHVGEPDAKSAGYTACSKAVVFPKLVELVQGLGHISQWHLCWLTLLVDLRRCGWARRPGTPFDFFQVPRTLHSISMGVKQCQEGPPPHTHLGDVLSLPGTSNALAPTSCFQAQGPWGWVGVQGLGSCPGWRFDLGEL